MVSLPLAARAALGLAVAAATMASAPSVASADVVYTYHNGYGTTDHVNINDNTQATDLWWVNNFTTQTGGEVITHVRLAFSGTFTVGTPISVLLYRDLDNDNDPDNMQLAMRLDTTIAMLHNVSNPATVQSVDIPDTAVGGSFFVGAMALNAPAGAGIRADHTNTQGRSYLAVNELAALGTLDPSNPYAAVLPPTNLDTLLGTTAPNGYEFYVEAVGVVPEPTSLGLAAVAGLALRRRQRRD